MKGTNTMTFKEFGEEAEITYNISVEVNGEVVFESYYFSDDSLQEDLRKVDNAIAEKLKEQYEDLPEPIEDEARGLAV
jgi:hypothetical protein